MQNKQTIHGVFVNINGRGVLITGDAGIGKSHAALMLLDRGHQFIADDVIEISKQNDNLIGRCPDKLFGLLKVRGLNLININDIFNHQVLIKQHVIDFVIHLADIDDDQVNNLHGTTDTITLLGIKIPRITLMPNYSNMAFIIELAVKNYQPVHHPVEQLICA